MFKLMSIPALIKGLILEVKLFLLNRDPQVNFIKVQLVVSNGVLIFFSSIGVKLQVLIFLILKQLMFMMLMLAMTHLLTNSRQ